MTDRKISRRTVLATAGASVLALSSVKATSSESIAIPPEYLQQLRQMIQKVNGGSATPAEAEETLGLLCALGWVFAFGPNDQSQKAAKEFLNTIEARYQSDLRSEEIVRRTHNQLLALYQFMNPSG